MAKNKKNQKLEKTTAEVNEEATVTATKDTPKTRRTPDPKPKQILFSKENYMFIGIGLLIVIVGFVLMAGGKNTPDEWHEDVIYSFQRITLAPFIVLSGLAVVIFAIFKTPSDAVAEEAAE